MKANVKVLQEFLSYPISNSDAVYNRFRWLEKNEQKEGENRPIGLILCSEKSSEQINYLMLDNDEQIKVAEYLTLLPEKKLLLEKLEKAIAIAENINRK